MSRASLAACPACGTSGAAPLGQSSDLHFHRCRHCTLVFVHPQPRERVRAKYVDGYDLAEHFAPWAARKRVLYERRLAKLPNPAPGRNRICDVGCGDGQFLALAMSRGWTAWGIELNPPAAAAARARGATVAGGVIEELDDLPWGRFDLVTSWDVLEHTPDPRPFAERLVRLLAPDGTLVVTTLNYDSLVRRCFGWNWSMVCDDHFTYWNPSSLRRLFASLGLRQVEAHSFGLGRDFVGAIDRLARRRRHVRAAPRRAPAPADVAGSPTTGGWDVNGVVLGLESAVNHALDATGLGVGVEAIFRRA